MKINKTIKILFFIVICGIKSASAVSSSTTQLIDNKPSCYSWLSWTPSLFSLSLGTWLAFEQNKQKEKPLHSVMTFVISALPFLVKITKYKDSLSGIQVDKAVTPSILFLLLGKTVQNKSTKKTCEVGCWLTATIEWIVYFMQP